MSSFFKMGPTRADKLKHAVERYCEAWNNYDRAADLGELTKAHIEAIGAAQGEIHVLLDQEIMGLVRNHTHRLHPELARVVGVQFTNGLKITI